MLFLSAGQLLADAKIDHIKAQIRKALPDIPLDNLKPSPVKGLYQLEVGPQIIYVSSDGKFIIMGSIIDLATKENITTARRSQILAKEVQALDENNMIVMGDKNSKRTITVFTDVDCPYCVKLHLEVPQLTKSGVKVRYLLYPRNGLGSKTYARSVAVWCAKDRVKAVGIAKAGGKLEMKTCSNPVADHYELGQRMGITGTPTIILDDGQTVGGYKPASQLLLLLGLGKT